MNKNNLFDPEYKVVGDWEWIVRNKNLSAKYLKGTHIIFPLGGMSNGPKGIKRKIEEHKKIRGIYNRRINLREIRFYLDFIIYWFLSFVKK